ncbi:hypothetical protein DSO57_1022094 [Entomophthora muscae]|uniref:Uncharacterized protein n=1 Tax=Entomophthora muscae TaxID=34485 RepID=A0ACC2SFW4_9FUNG|nr:hypothetical protein DSO57_1022094 [Entomophthora muscae]
MILIGVALFALVARGQLEMQSVLDCKFLRGNHSGKLDSLDIWKVDHGQGTFTVRVRDATDLKLLDGVGECETSIPNLGSHVRKWGEIRSNRSSFDSPSEDIFGRYATYTGMRKMLFVWAKSHPGLATFIPSIGRSVEGRDLFAFKISTGPGRRSIWINGGIHAREWISPAAVLYIINQLLTEKPELLNYFDFHFTPLANPDGYVYSYRYDRLWRKNRRRNSDGTFGVDLNRNWDEHWGVVGSSRSPRDETYCGPSAASEPEVKALSKYVLGLNNAYGAIDFHSYSQMILRNWGWSEKVSSNEQHLAVLGEKMKEAYNSRGYNFVSQNSAGLYPASGALDDWMAAKAKLVSFTVELCPGQDDSAGFQLPPEQIRKCADATYSAFKEFVNYLIENPNIPPNSIVS